jgi:hypothetical protein
MNKGDSYKNQEVLRLCRSINKRANDLEKLQPLVIQLHEVLTQVNYESLKSRIAAQPHEDNPFDKIVDSDVRYHSAAN